MGTPAAHADTVIAGCTIVSNPTPTNHTNCPGANFEQSDLTGMNLAYANLAGAQLSSAKLVSANLTGTDLSNAQLGNARLDWAKLPDANLRGAWLHLTAAFNADLTNADFTNAKVGYTRLDNANLTGANFTNANISGSYFHGTLLIPAAQRAFADLNTNSAVATWPTPPNLTGTTFESCDRASGSTFSVGDTSVRCTVRTTAGAGFGVFTVTVTPSSLPTVTGDPHNAQVDTFYSFTFSRTGQPQPRITTTSSLPPGMTLDETGYLYGTPTQSGTFPLTLTARSEAGEHIFETRLVVKGNGLGSSSGGSSGSSDSGSGSNIFGS
ncbi:pentapeptide repeat-containing protein [Prescottella defluvii]|nr:pentapeptide repeat-containing protein [Prescottella defluvii]